MTQAGFPGSALLDGQSEQAVALNKVAKGVNTKTSIPFSYFEGGTT